MLTSTSRAPVKTHVVSGRYLGDGKCEAEVEFDVLKPLPERVEGADKDALQQDLVERARQLREQVAPAETPKKQ